MERASFVFSALRRGGVFFCTTFSSRQLLARVPETGREDYGVAAQKKGPRQEFGTFDLCRKAFTPGCRAPQIHELRSRRPPITVCGCAELSKVARLRRSSLRAQNPLNTVLVFRGSPEQKRCSGALCLVPIRTGSGSKMRK